ncbi:MAG TPA: hypothetical protein VK168_06005 [Saprospiraceae bacterium]|nr:hypothetical protein [Saprospiraceae bacterium]
MEKNSVDKGWVAMQQMLDREMPVKKRRRAAWWWLGLLLIPVASLAGWWYALENPKTVPVPISSQPITQNQHNSYPAATLAESHNTNQTVSTTLQTTPAALTAKYTQKRRQNLQKPISSIPTLTIDQVQTPNPIQNPKEIDLARIDILPAQPFPSSPSSQPVARETAALPTKPATSFKPFWSVGATSMASTEKFETVNGFSTGVTVDWAFSRKWGLRTGFLYNIHTPQEESRPVASIIAENYTVEGEIWALDMSTGQQIWQMPGTSTLTDNLQGNVYVPVSRLQRLELPVSVYWQTTKSLKVYSGLSVAKTLITKADRFNYSGVYQINLNDQVAEKDVSNLSAHSLNTWNVQAIMGIGWRVSPVFELGLNGSLPFQRIKRLEGIANDNNGVPDYTSIRVRTQRTPLLALYGTIYF